MDLDFAAFAALQYAQAWAFNRGHRSAPLAVIVRRALVNYAAHLEAIAQAEPSAQLQEVRAVEVAGKRSSALHPYGTATSEAAAAALALERLEDLRELPPGDAWPPFRDVLYGAEAVGRGKAAHLALEAQVESHLQSIASTPRGRLRGLGKTAPG